MKRLALVLMLTACGGTDVPEPRTYEFGPYTLAPGQEINNQCVSVTLDNDEPLYISAVELTTGPGFHHSNWFTVEDYLFDGPDGTWPCAERGYDEAVIGIQGRVLFAQSTQATQELQQFPDGVALEVPARSRIVAGTHLLNSGDDTLNLPLSIKITPVAKPATVLSPLAFTNESIRIPPMRTSRFTMECDVNAPYQNLEGHPADFRFYYGLAHYHELGTGIAIEGVRADGTTDTIFSTTNRVGDLLGGMISPPVSVADYAKLRFWCEFTNPRTQTVRWGVGDQEMCTVLAFTDSTYTFGGGVLNSTTQPLTTVDHGAYIESTYACDLITRPRDE